MDKENSFTKVILIFIGINIFCLGTLSYLYFSTNEKSSFENQMTNFTLFKKIQDFSNDINDKKIDEYYKDKTKVNQLAEEINSINEYLGLNDKIGIVNSLNKEINHKVLNIDKAEFKKSWARYVSLTGNFYQFVYRNNWKTLTRISLRVKSRTSIFSSFDRNYSKTIIDNNRDMISMEKVTKRSSLAAVSKKQILEKINEIKREHNILKTRFSDIKNEILKLEIVSRKIKAWVASTEPLLFKSAKENVSYKKLFKYLLLGLFIFTSLGFIFFLFLNKKSIEAAKYIFEKKLVSILDLIIIKNDLNFMSEYSTKTQNSILSYAEYLKKRVNFGLLFQEAMPLPSVMLDRHLNIKWFNKHFLEQWGFDAEELLNTNKNWQNLREKTNIGTNDPIMESLESNIAGIYQIQIKNIKEEKPRPYQMYVSPVTVYGEQSIMLFFYPLMTLEETVEIQTRSIVEPVKETLEVILNNGYDDRYEVESIRNYNIAGIEDIHEKFSKIFKKHKDEVDVLLKEINDLEQTIKSDHKIIKDFEDINQNASLNVQGQLDKFKKLKNDIIQISTLANKGFGNYFDQKRGILGFTEDFKYFATKYQSFNKELNTFINSLPLIQQMKQNIKSNKDDFKKLSFALVNLNKNFERTFEKVELSGHKKTMIYQNLSDLKKCLKNLEGFEKNLMSVDIFFSKFALIVEELLKKSENEVLMDQFLELKSELNKLLRALDEHRIDQSHIDQAEEQIVASIREFYHHIKSNYKIYEALPSSQELSN